MRSAILPTAIAAVLGSPAAAQDWTHHAWVYGWAPDSAVTLDTPRGSVTGELSFGDALERLDVAFMGAFEARNAQVSLIVDTLFLGLSDDRALPAAAGFPSADLESDVWITNAYALWALPGVAQGRLDVGGGVRFFQLDSRVDLVGGPVPFGFASSESWADPVIALRWQGELGGAWYGGVFADIGGGGGSDLTWQVLGTVGYAVSDRLALEGGYRVLRSERDVGSVHLDIEMQGPVLGLRWTF